VRIALAYAPGTASEQRRRDENAERIGNREYTTQETVQEGIFRVSNCDRNTPGLGCSAQIR
jgi:hypothetical protein